MQSRPPTSHIIQKQKHFLSHVTDPTLQQPIYKQTQYKLYVAHFRAQINVVKLNQRMHNIQFFIILKSHVLLHGERSFM
jgi:hypothetical protein